MSTGWIRDYSQRTTSDERKEFSTDFFQAPTGNAKHRDLTWDTEVEIDDSSFSSDSSRVQCTLNDNTGWINSIKLKNIRLSTT